MANLYEITGDMLMFQSMVEENELDPQVIADTMESLQGEFDEKLESYCKIIKNLETDAAGVKSEIKRLTERKAGFEKNIESMKKAMFEAMKATNTTRVTGELFTVAIQKNGGKIPVVMDVADTSELPDEFVRIKEEPDIDAIRGYIEKHGTCKYAHYGERGESLRIK